MTRSVISTPVWEQLPVRGAIRLCRRRKRVLCDLLLSALTRPPGARARVELYTRDAGRSLLTYPLATAASASMFFTRKRQKKKKKMRRGLPGSRGKRPPDPQSFGRRPRLHAAITRLYLPSSSLPVLRALIRENKENKKTGSQSKIKRPRK